MGSIIATGLIGLSLGAQYALLALGFTLIFGIVGVMNFAHGAFYALGGYVAFALVHYWGFPYPVAVLCAAVVSAVVGYLFELLLLERTINDGLATLMLTLGLSMVMTTGFVAAFGPEAQEFQFPVTGILSYAGVFVPLANLIMIGASLAIIGAVYLMMYRTGLGRALRALASDRTVASSLGLRARLLFPLAFGVATGLAGITGALVTPILSLAPHIGESVLATSFIVVILGGLGSMWGATLAAFIVGLIEAFSSVYLGGSKGALALFVIVLVILVVKPSGLFGREVRGA